MTDTVTPEQTDKDTERALGRDKAREKALAAAEHLLSVEGIVEWINVRRRYKYSWGNQILIAMQAPEAAFVASRTDWKKYGRAINDDALPVMIWNKPFLSESKTQVDDKGKPKTFRVFLPSGIFAIENTTVVNEKLWEKYEPILFSKQRRTTLPEDAIQPLDGDSHKKAIPALKALAKQHGWKYSGKVPAGHDGARGVCSFGTMTIHVDTTLPINQQVQTFIHELVHALGETTYTKLGRARSEVITEVTAYVVCETIGLASDQKSVGYIATFLDQVRQQSSDTVKAMKKATKAIDNVAKMIEDVLIPALDIEVVAT
jgi:hypothetical protein